MSETARLSATITGLVQGVGFRYFALARAKNLGLTGYVRNLPGGRAVEVVAEGEKQQLEELLQDLRQGPPGAWVERIETQWSPSSNQYLKFDIRYS